MQEQGAGQWAAALAAELDRADREHRQLPRPGVVALGLQEAYEVQSAGLALRSARRRSPVGAWKVALTSTAAQAALAADEPASGRLLAVDVRPTGAQVAAAELFAPLLEVELVFRLREDLPPGAGTDDVLARCDVAAALECPDGRWADWFGGDFPALPLPAVVADRCLAGLLVLGPVWRPAEELRGTTVRARLSDADGVLAEGDTGNVLGSPAASVVWLQAQQCRTGTGLRAGDLVSSGTLTPPVRWRPGRVVAQVSDGLGEVAATLLG